MVTIDKNNAHHSERSGRYAIKPKHTGNTAALGADVPAGDTDLIEATTWDHPAELSTRHLWNGSPVIAHPDRPDWLGVAAPVAGAPLAFSVHSTAKISGISGIDNGTTIGERSVVRRDTILTNVEVGDDVTIDKQSSIGGYARRGSPNARTVIGDSSIVTKESTVSAGCRVGKRCVVGSRAVLNNVTTGDDVWFGYSANVANVHVPDGMKIGNYAAIEGPGDMVDLCPGERGTGRPAISFHRISRLTPRGVPPQFTGYIAVSYSDIACQIEVDDLGDDNLRSAFYEELAGGDASNLDATLLDSPDGNHEGIISMLEDPARLAAIMKKSEEWSKPRDVATG